MAKNFPARRGVALIMILMVLIILVVLVGQLSYSTKVDYYTAQNNSDDLQNHYALISAINHAIAYLQLDYSQEKESGENNDSFQDEWCKPHQLNIGETQVVYTITDENSKFNLLTLLERPKKKEKKKKEGEDGEGGEQNPPPTPEKEKEPEFTTAQQLERLLGLVLEKQPKAVAPAALRESIVAWLKDKSGKKELEGPFQTKVPILSLKELLLAKEITPLILFGGTDKDGTPLAGIADYLTVCSDGLININTAPKKVLQCLSPKLDDNLAGKIIQYRQTDTGVKEIFKKEDDLKKVEGMSPEGEKETAYSHIENFITVRSHYFTIQAIATSGRMTKTMTVIVYRSGKRVYKLYSDEE